MNQSIKTTYKQLTDGKTIDDAIYNFKTLEINSHDDGNIFFEKYGVGNTINSISRPKERFSCYQSLLSELKNTNKKKYDLIHKGTAFYFLSALSFDLNSYDNFVFYLDCAISEYKRAVNKDWIYSPMAKMLRLENGGSMDRITNIIEKYLSIIIEIYNKNLNGNLSKDKFINDFVLNLMDDKDDRKRSIITALYSYILEYINKLELIENKGASEGTIEPWTIHLFKGGLILESILKIKYQKDRNSHIIKTFNGFNSNNFFIKKYGKINTSSNDFSQILKDINNKNSINAINTTAKIRNVSGHNLIRDNVFNDPLNYRNLFEQTINAIFYVIEKEYINI